MKVRVQGRVEVRVRVGVRVWSRVRFRVRVGVGVTFSERGPNRVVSAGVVSRV